MTSPRLASLRLRAGLLALCLLAPLAGCDDSPDAPAASALAPGSSSGTPAPAPAPISYDYLPKLGLDVAEVAVDDTWTPPAGTGVHVEEEATPLPVEALARLIHDRLVATGGAGRALATIEDASIVRLPDQLVGSFAIQITLEGVAGEAPPPVVASVSGTRTLASDANEATTANTLLRELMDRMNVELEYQIRHNLASHMGGSAAPVPAPVQSQDLAPPPGTAPPVPAQSAPVVPAPSAAPVAAPSSSPVDAPPAP
jgi:hypothetical protein